MCVDKFDLELFKESLKNCDTLKIVLKGVGETSFKCEDVLGYLENLEKKSEKNTLVKEEIVKEHDLILRKMDSIDISNNDAMLDRWSHLNHYKNGLVFCLDQFKNKGE